MKDVVLIGAFDRYSYGENLMPTVYESFVKGFCPSIISQFRLIYASLTVSGLSTYKKLSHYTPFLQKVIPFLMLLIDSVLNFDHQSYLNHSGKLVRLALENGHKLIENLDLGAEN